MHFEIHDVLRVFLIDLREPCQRLLFVAQPGVDPGEVIRGHILDFIRNNDPRPKTAARTAEKPYFG